MNEDEKEKSSSSMFDFYVVKATYCLTPADARCYVRRDSVVILDLQEELHCNSEE